MEQIEIRSNVPKEVEPDLKNLQMMDKGRALLQQEYGQVYELNDKLITGLMRFPMSKEVKTEVQQITELQRKWTQVVEDLREVNRINCLDNPVVIQSILRKLPGKDSQL